MVEIKNKGKIDDYVYDISLDGTVVNALGLNIVSNTDGFNFALPKKFRYTKEHPYIGKGLSRETKEGVEYIGFEGDVAEFNDQYMRDFHYSPTAVNKMGLGIDEVVDATINFARKNYADYFPEKPFPEDVKLVGNTIKSKKMPEYIAKFLSVGIRLLLNGKGQEFINEYYDYLEKIYNYKIPLRDIATKGKIKKSIKEYKQDVSQITKAGRPKSRQAWYELAIAYNLIVDNGDTVYYVNTGKSKSHSDVKKVTHYFYTDENNEKIEFTKSIDRDYKKYKLQCIEENKTPIEKADWICETYPNYYTEDEISLNCMPLPRDIVESEDDIYCNEENNIKYNTAKYVEMFNKRITPLLVGFSKEIRNNILISDPKDRKYFTEEQCVLISGEPNKITDQDTYEQLMTMEDKEIKFWTTYNLTPPFFEECGMGNWEEVKKDYFERMKKEKENGVDKVREAYERALNKLTNEEVDAFIEDAVIPKSIDLIVKVDPMSNNFISKKYEDVIIGTINDIIDKKYESIMDVGEVEVSA